MLARISTRVGRWSKRTKYCEHSGRMPPYWVFCSSNVLLSLKIDPSACHNGSRSILKKKSYFDIISDLYNLLPLLTSDKILAWIIHWRRLCSVGDQPTFHFIGILCQILPLMKLFQRLEIVNFSKGQIILKANLLVLNSSKKQTKYLPNSVLATRAEVFKFFFGIIKN